MYINELNICNFKNIESSFLSFKARVNCFVGHNGAGKTNYIDAIYYLSMCKSITGCSDKQNIRHGEDFFTVNGRYSHSEQGENTYNCVFRKTPTKQIQRNGKNYKKISEHIGAIPIVTITPRDNALIDESGEERRRYLDTFISQFDRNYLTALIRYNSIIAERNALLRSSGGGMQSDMLEIYDMQLVPLAETIYTTRLEVIESLAPLVKHYYSTLADGSEEVDVTYYSQLSKTPMAELLQNALERDSTLGFTSVGVGRDDLRLTIDGYAIKRYGSQGQQKSLLIALKLAQYEILAKNKGIKPLMLLDDIFDRLDRGRVARLLEIVKSGTFGQIFITDCDSDRVGKALSGMDGDYEIFTTSKGSIIEK